jgi:hypothetical protein
MQPEMGVKQYHVKTREFREDALTADLARALTDPEILAWFWQIVAPMRLRNQKPIFKMPTLSSRPADRLGATKPDLLFRAHDSDRPLLYLEAKLGCGTEPLQLTRARSWMRASGAKDDQVLLVSQYVDRLPDSAGWGGPIVPVQTMSWTSLEQNLKRNGPHYSPSARTTLARFSSKLNERCSQELCKTKRRLSFRSKHCFGQIMYQLAAHWSGADFVYGANIDPRLCAGNNKWRQVFGTPDVERLHIFYGAGKEAVENYRAQLILWHASDLAHSRDGIRKNWDAWREGIGRYPKLKFEWGGRHGYDRQVESMPPEQFPESMVGLVKMPRSSAIYESEFRSISDEQLVARIAEMVRPFEKLIEEVASSFRS